MKKTLRKSLFWEVNLEDLDYQRDVEFIIGRVLDLGNLKEWRAIKNFYGLDKIKKVARKHVFSDPKSANFWSIIVHIPLEKIKCTRNPSLKTPKAFLKR